MQAIVASMMPISSGGSRSSIFSFPACERNKFKQYNYFYLLGAICCLLAFIVLLADNVNDMKSEMYEN